MSKRTRILLITLCFTLALFSVATYSFMFRVTDNTVNTFVDGNVAVTFNGSAIFNNSNTPVFVRVRFVAYYTDGNGNIAGVASPAITCSSNPYGWLQGSNNTWYYPNALGAATANSTPNISIPVVTAASLDGYTLVIESFAEAIQSSPATAANQAWGVTVSGGAITAVP